MRTIAQIALLALLCVVLAACSLAPTYERPEQELPESWKSVDMGPAPLNQDWWTRFNDPVLTKLVEEALEKNQDLAESMASIESAAAQAGVGSAALLPIVNGAADLSAQSQSLETANNSFRNAGVTRKYTNYQGTLSASWELDFWGANRSSYTALTDIMLATVMSHEALRLSIAGQVAQSYFELLALDMQLDTARRTLRTREEGMRIYMARYKQGDITELDMQRANAEVETARSQVHTSIIAVDAAEAALAVLTGRSPREIMTLVPERGARVEKLPVPPVLPEGLPSDLLERRPDIRAAEYSLLATNQQIGAARAAFFPIISLTGYLGTASSGVSNLFSAASGLWNYGASVALPIFDAGRNWYNLKDAEAQKRAAIAVYRKTVQNAFSDIRTALTAQSESREVVKSMELQVRSLRRAAELARLQYNNGYTDYLTVLDAERSLFTAELSLANAFRDRLNAIVSVCMALGGGWEDPMVRPGFPPEQDTEGVIAAQRKGTAQVRAEKAAAAAAEAEAGQ